MTRVIHTGDTHLGYRQYHMPERRDDFLSAFQRVIRDAIEGEVDAVVHAGDLFHDRRPDLTDLLGTLSTLRELRAADIPFLAIVGNHEHKRDRQWLELFETLDLATRLGDEPVVVGETAFYGLDHVPLSKRDQLEYQFAEHDASYAALVAHGLFTPFSHGNWNTEEVLTRTNLDIDVMLLGDNHIPDKAEVEGTWVTYCGSTERASAAEREPRGYNIVEFDAASEEDSESHADVSITRRGIDTRQFVFIDLELGEDEGLERVRERIREEEIEDAVVIVTIDGEGEDIAPAGIEEFAKERGALVARVNDHREIEAESVEYGVSFADPDDAVAERVRDLGLSAAAKGIDETVRASKVADSNVRTEIESRVADLIDEDPSAFTTGGSETQPVETMAGKLGDGDADAPDESAETTDEPPEMSVETAGAPDESDEMPDESAETPNEPAETPDDAPAPSDETTPVEADGDGQASMEDYL